MPRIFTLLTLLIAIVSVPVSAKKIAGIDMPDTMDIAGASLRLNGAGVRTKMFMDIYVGGLYLIKSNSNSAQIIAADEPMSIRLHMVSGLITSEAMEEATLEGFENATGGKTGPIQAHIDDFVKVFQEPISEGDIFDIAHEPGEGLQVYKNGTFKSAVGGGVEFKKAVFAIWIGDKPANKGLKKGMLGK